MKHLLLAAAALSVAGAIGTANADPQLMSNSVEIWNGLNPSPGDSTNASQQGLPSSTAMFGGPLGLLAPTTTPYSQPINYKDTTDTTVGGFFTTAGNPVPATCLASATCPGTTISTATFNRATTMEFTFTVAAGGEALSIFHDDGISIFVPGTESSGISADLFGANSAAVAAPQAESAAPTTITLAAGNYDLWYNEANGLPAVLQATFTPVPAPLIGHGLLVLLAVGGVLFGGKILESLKTRHLHTA
jgi:hypothetical protein